MGHEYGPHREEDAPSTVTIRAPGKWSQEIEVPIPGALAKQRRQMNALAHGEPMTEVDRDQFDRLRGLVARKP